MHLDQFEVKKFEIFDLNKSTDLEINGASWEIRAPESGAVVVSGSATYNNADTDRAGNTIKTVSMTLDLVQTDLEVGFYWFLIFTSLTTQQEDIFRYPVEMMDLREFY